MGYMNFNNQLLEKVFKGFKWARNNTIEILEKAETNKILDYSSNANTKFKFQPIIFQFQCIATTTDTYYRKLTNRKNQEFGILVEGERIINKKDISSETLINVLRNQLKAFEELLKTFDDKKVEENIDLITALSNHEYLHQGQLILMMREAGVDLPERFRKAWAL